VRIAINGTGVAGPTLAYWLKRYGHEPVLFESAPALRTGGYMIDFWGVGYTVAERMGILPELHEKGYKIERLQIVGKTGKKAIQVSTDFLQKSLDDRFLSIARGDLAATIYRACGPVEGRFGTHIVGMEQRDDGVVAQLSNGSDETFDLVIGADGLHSHIRRLAFGEEADYEQSMHAYVAAFTLSGYRPRDELTYVTCPIRKRHVGRVSLRGDKTLFIFTFRSELVESVLQSPEEQRRALQTVFGEMGWEVPAILARLDEAEDLYFDHVSQIRMNRWTSGRVALIGDAVACVSLLAGEGTGLAMTEAYVLAGELHRASGDYRAAFQSYEQLLQPFLAQKQRSAIKMLSFFAAKNSWKLALAKGVLRAASIPFVFQWLLGPTLRDDLELPDYSTQARDSPH
jgi:2-polyprenyl-6-methoxyphenol hydroxylase-like FAD-dependent oxidoreductase